MLLSKDSNQGDYEIRSYEPGKIKINDDTFSQSVVLCAHRLEIWKPNSLQELTSQDFEIIIPLKPDLVLLGTGQQLVFPQPKLLKIFYDHQIGVEVMTTLAACRTFNVVMSEGRNAVAALLIS